MDAKFNKRVFIFLLLLLVLPLVQYFVPALRLPKLKGAINEPKEVVFTLEKWKDGSFQDLAEGYVKAKNGMRTLWVNINNQWNYSVNNIIRPAHIIQGKDDYLFTNGYIQSYLGEDYLGEDKVNGVIEDLERIRDTLLTKNCEMIVALAPSKAWYMPENIPEEYDLAAKTISNYQMFSQSLLQSDIPSVDFNKWFIQMKDTTSYPLYPKGGIHWSIYGGTLAADSLSRLMTELREVAPVEYNITGVELTNDCRLTDDDICKAMNLMYWPGEHDVMAYPKIDFISDTTMRKPKVMSISDSFYWTFINTKVHKKAYAKGSQFWFYFKNVYGDGKKRKVNVRDLETVFDEMDFVLLLATEQTLDRFPYGFIEAMKETYNMD